MLESQSKESSAREGRPPWLRYTIGDSAESLVFPERTKKGRYSYSSRVGGPFATLLLS